METELRTDYDVSSQGTADGDGTDQSEDFIFRPIGWMESWFKTKNGTPRQPSVCSLSKGSITVQKSIFNNPDHALQGLAEYSHVWGKPVAGAMKGETQQILFTRSRFINPENWIELRLLFVFHKNAANKHCKAKVNPPRLNGARVGVFATRSPHRPNAIGLTLAKLERVEGATIHVSGIDILDGTPILDIKPFVPDYDRPQLALTDPPCSTLGSSLTDRPSSKPDGVTEPTRNKAESTSCFVPTWLVSPPIQELTVLFTPRAEKQLNMFSGRINVHEMYRLQFLKDASEARAAIKDILRADPRSVYRRSQCTDRLYYFVVDQMHITCWFDGDEVVEVLKVMPVSCQNVEGGES